MEVEIEPAYPQDDGLPTPEQMSAIGRMVLQDIKVKLLSSLFDETTNKQNDETSENKLDELMAAVTEENRHKRIDFGKPVGREIL